MWDITARGEGEGALPLRCVEHHFEEGGGGGHIRGDVLSITVESCRTIL